MKNIDRTTKLVENRPQNGLKLVVPDQYKYLSNNFIFYPIE